MKLDLEIVGVVLLAALLIGVGVNTYNTMAANQAEKVVIEEQLRLEALPASDWLVVNDVFVPDTVVGEDFNIFVDRKIKQPFDGHYFVQLRHFPSNVNACTAEAKTPYRPDAELENPLTWSWWAFPQCENYRPEEGQYRIHTQWEVDTGYAGVKEVSSVSNVFTVHKQKPDEVQEQLEQKLEVLEEQVEDLENNR